MKYAEFHNSNLYHIVGERDITLCSIVVVAQSDQFQTYADTEYPMPRIVSHPSTDKKLCPRCAKKKQQK